MTDEINKILFFLVAKQPSMHFVKTILIAFAERIYAHIAVKGIFSNFAYCFFLSLFTPDRIYPLFFNQKWTKRGREIRISLSLSPPLSPSISELF